MKFSSFLLTCLLVCLINISCKKSAAECSSDWSREIKDELEAVVSASLAYGSTPNATTCAAYKNRYIDYINALKDLDGCSALTGQNRTDWQNAIKEAETEANSIKC